MKGVVSCISAWVPIKSRIYKSNTFIPWYEEFVWARRILTDWYSECPITDSVGISWQIIKDLKLKGNKQRNHKIPANNGAKIWMAFSIILIKRLPRFPTILDVVLIVKVLKQVHMVIKTEQDISENSLLQQIIPGIKQTRYKTSFLPYPSRRNWLQLHHNVWR